MALATQLQLTRLETIGLTDMQTM